MKALSTVLLLPYFIYHQDFKQKIQSSIQEYSDVLKSVILNKESPTWDNFVMPQEVCSKKMSDLHSVIGQIKNTYFSEEVAKAYQEILPIISAFYNDLSQNVDVYEGFVNLKKSQQYKDMSVSQKSLIDLTIKNYELSGIHLPEKEKLRLKEINKNLSLASNKFSNNVINARNAYSHHITKEQFYSIEDLPEDILKIMAEKAKSLEKSGWIITLDAPVYSAVMTYSKDRELRKILHEANTSLASDISVFSKEYSNDKNIAEILSLRFEKAKILGFNCYAEYSIAKKSAPNLETVVVFLHDLSQKSKAKAQQELQSLKDFAKEIDDLKEFEVWDMAFYNNLYIEKKYNVSKKELRKYFPINKVLTGMFELSNKLFGIKIVKAQNDIQGFSNLELYEVYDKHGVVRGAFFLDLYARETKSQGAWMNPVHLRIKKDGKTIVPVSFLVTNFTPPSESKEALLYLDDVNTLFHEFGHTLHSLMTTIDYPSISGTNVKWDVVEAPSQFFENWMMDWQVIQSISEHVDTKKGVSKDLFDKLHALKKYNKAIFLNRQLLFALIDISLHSSDTTENFRSIVEKLYKDLYIFPYEKNNRFTNSFLHIFDGGYAAGYYSYLWADVLATDIFSKFEENGGISEKVGQEFLHNILEPGASVDFLTLFERFRGRTFNNQALLKKYGIN